MNVLSPLLFTGLIIFLLSCDATINDKGRAVPLISKDTSNKNERKNKLFVFVGEKIKITPVASNPGDFDSHIKAKYLVLQRVYGSITKDTIEFDSYDHFGRFAFAEHKNVLLYVSEHEGKLYHEKYMYDPLFKTKDGRWAGPYSDDYGHQYNEYTTVKPEKIDFAEEVSFPINRKDKQHSLIYPEPFFKIAGDKAIAVYGNFVPELFKLKKDGVLTARELFGNTKLETK